MNGATDLNAMLKSLDPIADPRRFVFASFPGMTLSQAEAYLPVGTFLEPEGLTLILVESALQAASDEPRFAMISLQVHSSLEAVGLTAAISTALTEHGISANVVAAAYHDHIFVPVERCDEALAVLRALGS